MIDLYLAYLHIHQSQPKQIADAPPMRCQHCLRERPRANLLLAADPADAVLLHLRGYTPGKEPAVECRDEREACEWYMKLWYQVGKAIHEYEEWRKEQADAPDSQER